MTFTTASTIICVMLWIIVFAVMVYNREDRIRFYFASKKVQMAQLHDLKRQLQEAWENGNSWKETCSSWRETTVNVAIRWKEAYDNITDQLHRVARERDNERKLRLAAMKDKDYLIDRFHEERDARMSYEEQLTRAQVRVAAAEDALLDYHLDKDADPMDGPEFIWVHLNHPCREIDVWYVTQPEEAKFAKRQGYIPLTTLRLIYAAEELRDTYLEQLENEEE